jgi:type II secretory ATPase GspE/PulE/Tfp pilus assembly ATPase PilB-like protein
MESSGTDFVLLKKDFKESIKFFEEKLEKKGILDREERDAVSNVITSSDEKELLVKILAERLFLDSFTDKASDIHLEPLKDGLMVKYRIKGYVEDIKLLSPETGEELIIRLKHMADLEPDITEKVQSGKIMIETDKIIKGDNRFDVKLGIIPVIYGERLTMRIKSMEKAKAAVDQGLELLQFGKEDLEKVKEIFNKPFGLVIVTGTSGSGKTTTCHGALNYILKKTAGHANIMSLEESIEYPMKGISQIQVQPDGEGYYELLKGIMWHDPDVIFVGDVSDSKTARMISEIALTGHLIIVQLTSPDIFQSVDYLKNLGLEPYLLASILEGAISQRLVRKICEKCKEKFTPSTHVIEKYFSGHEHVSLYRGKGCSECHNSGYKGRTGIYETGIFDTELKEAIADGEDINKLKKVFQEKGFRSLREKAIDYVLSGVTTLEEALRVSY